MALKWKWSWLVAALALAGCSKKAPDDSGATTSQFPDTAPGLMESADKPAAEATAPLSQADGVIRARFDGYARRVAGSLWQTVFTTGNIGQYALLVPTKPVPEGAAGLQADGPENIAVATEGLLMETAENRPLVVGREYDFVFSRNGGFWSVEIARAP